MYVSSKTVQINDENCHQRPRGYFIPIVSSVQMMAHTSLGKVLSVLIESGDIKHGDSYRSHQHRHSFIQRAAAGPISSLQ